MAAGQNKWKSKIMTRSEINRFYNIILENKFISFPLIILTIILITLLICTSKCSCNFVAGIFAFIIAITTALIAIHKYQYEQRVSRIQKLYFENVFLGQATSIEELMSVTNKNYMLYEYAANLMLNLIKNEARNLSFLKEEIKTLIDNVTNRIVIGSATTDFKKETISKLFSDKAGGSSRLSAWIKIFEDDAFRFSNLLSGQLQIIKNKSRHLDDENLNKFNSSIHEITKSIDYNYNLIQRHYILFSLLSELVYQLSDSDYSNPNNITKFLHSEKIKNVKGLIDSLYELLVKNFDDVVMGNMNQSQSEMLIKEIEKARSELRQKIK